MKNTFFTALFAFLAAALSAQTNATFDVCSYFWKDSTPMTHDLVFLSPQGSFPSPITFNYTPVGAALCHQVEVPMPPAYATMPLTVLVSRNDNGNCINGISVADMYLVGQHILGITSLQNPAQLIAADVNKSGSITTFDIVTIRKVLIGLAPPNSITPSWRFYKGYTPTPSQPFGITPDTLGKINGKTLTSFGVRVGDVDGDADPNAPCFQALGTAPIPMLLPEAVLPANAAMLVPVAFDGTGQITGLQLDFSIDSNLVAVENIVSGEALMTKDVNYTLTNSRFRTIMVYYPASTGPSIGANKPLFYLVVRAKQNVSVKDAIQLDPSGLAPLLIKDGQVVGIERFGLKPVYDPHLQLSVSNHETEAARFVVDPVANPFRDRIVFQIESAAAETAQIEIADLHGRVCHRQIMALSEGQQWVEISGETLGNGPFLYRITAGKHTASGKLVRI